MNEAPEQIWVHSYDDKFDGDCDVLQEHCSDGTQYTRTDVAQAMVAAAYEAARKAAFHACKSAGSGYVDENERLLQRAENEFRLEVVKAIRALTPTDAKAALDRIVQEVVKEADTPETAAQQLLMVENIDTIADACRQFRVPQEKFRAILSALKGGEA